MRTGVSFEVHTLLTIVNISDLADHSTDAIIGMELLSESIL